jgi:MoaA/NifB/PqqE/SkfB family radical SAM enzyme
MKALSVHLTDVCNSKCSFCIVDSPHIKIDSIERDRVSRFLRAHQDQGYDAVNLHGGEPTLRRDFLNILDEIRELGYPTVSLQTNGRRLASKAFAREAVARGVSLFIISMHGADAKTQDGISRSANSFRQAVDGIRNVKALGTRVRTNTVVCKQNYETLPDIVSLCVSLGADHVNISALHTAGTAFRNFWDVTPTYTQIQAHVFEAVDRVVAAGRVVTLEGFPYCSIPGYEHYMINWGEQRLKMLFRRLVMADYEQFMDTITRVKDGRCEGCMHNHSCGGVYKEYADLIGWDEFHPVTSTAATATA